MSCIMRVYYQLCMEKHALNEISKKKAKKKADTEKLEVFIRYKKEIR